VIGTLLLLKRFDQSIKAASNSDWRTQTKQKQKLFQKQIKKEKDSSFKQRSKRPESGKEKCLK